MLLACLLVASLASTTTGAWWTAYDATVNDTARGRALGEHQNWQVEIPLQRHIVEAQPEFFAVCAIIKVL